MSSPSRSRIPFNRPTHTRLVDEYVAQALHSGHLSGDGDFTRRCQDLLRDLLGGATVLLTTSGTHALELIALLLDIGPGDESSFHRSRFRRPSTPSYFAVLRRCSSISGSDTLNLDERKLEALITPRTRAIVPVHYAGVGCEMERILDVSRHDTAIPTW